MRDRGVILTGLVVFLGLITFPVWWNLAYGKTSRGPELRKPVGKQCVLPTSLMRTSHMDLLMDWREKVVRSGVRTYHAAGGREYRMSLSKTCLGECHSSKAEFCDRCHDYAAMQPYCWDCHVDSTKPLPYGRGSVTADLVHAQAPTNALPTPLTPEAPVLPHDSRQSRDPAGADTPQRSSR